MSVVELFSDHPFQFIWQVYLPIGAWLTVVLIFFVILLRKYTFGKWTEENPNPYMGETFDMPRGVFRGTLTLTLVFVVTVLELVNVRVVGFEDEIHELMVAFQMMIAFYFGSKVMHHMSSTDRKKTEAIATSSSQMAASEAGDAEFDEDGAAG